MSEEARNRFILHAARNWILFLDISGDFNNSCTSSQSLSDSPYELCAHTVCLVKSMILES